MYRFALRPKWIAGHVLALTAIVVFVLAGFWQLRRLDERQALNAEIEAVADLPPVPLDAAEAEGSDVAWRLVELTGSWESDEQVLVRNRTLDGQPGYHLVTPLELGDGRAVAVNRGWIPLSAVDDDRATSVDTPAGEVTVLGRLRDSERARGLASADPAEGVLAVVSRVDVDRLDQQTAAPLVERFAELVDDDVPFDAVPQPVPEPELSEGPHLSYAGQWFLFTLVVLIGYPLVLRWAARTRDEHDGDDHEPQPVSA
ncbi:MAG: SURF1 family protein [Actinomycetota bacterium]